MTSTEPAAHAATSLVVGVAAAAWDRLAAGPARPAWRDVAVGALFEAEDAASALVSGTRRAVADRRGRIARLADGARQRVAALAARGAAEQDHGRRWAVETADVLVTAVATAPVVERVVDAQVDRLVRPLVASVLDDVLTLLEEHPDRVRALVRGQRDTLVTELVGRIRESAGAGDLAVDRITTPLRRHGGSPPAGASSCRHPGSGPPSVQ